MRFTIDQLTLAASLLATVVSATPMSKGSTFTAKQVRATTRSNRRTGAGALKFAYHRYGKKMPSKGAAGKKSDKQKAFNPRSASASTDDGTVTATPSDLSDDEYICQVQIGGQTVNLDFDTGSSDLWVFSAELKKSKIGNHSIYDPTKSTTSKLLNGATWDISYGDGSSAKGNVYADTVSVGGSVATGQAVELASKVSKQFVDDYASDGLLGLAFDNINTVSPTPQKTFFTNAKPNLAAPLFTADLNHDTPGSYDFGFIDSTKYTGSITYVPANNSQGFWGVTSTSYGVGDSSNMTTKSIDAIVDTGTSLLLVPQDVLDAYYGQVQGAKNSESDQGYIFPCQATLPDFIIGLGDYNAVIPGTAVNNTAVSDTHCYGGIQFSDPSSGPPGIYGDVFLKSSFVVFKNPDGGSPQIGFAAKGSNGSATPAPSSSSSSSTSSSSSGGGDSEGDDEEGGED